MRFASNIQEVRTNALKLHGYASGKKDEKKFHRIRVRNALHHVALETDSEMIFAPAKWSGAAENDMGSYFANKDPVTDHFRRVLRRIGFKQISPGSELHDELYEKFVAYCRQYGFTHSKPPKGERHFHVIEITKSRLYPDEVDDEENYSEGAKSLVTVNRYERDQRARTKCIEVHGVDCKVCGMNFSDIYGEIGEGFIHVHHKKPISEALDEYEIDPVNDLVPVCPNCHAMLHRRTPPFTVEQLAKKIEAGTVK